jgi:hypothetical protein
MIDQGGTGRSGPTEPSQGVSEFLLRLLSFLAVVFWLRHMRGSAAAASVPLAMIFWCGWLWCVFCIRCWRLWQVQVFVQVRCCYCSAALQAGGEWQVGARPAPGSSHGRAGRSVLLARQQQLGSDSIVLCRVPLQRSLCLYSCSTDL